MKSGESSLYNIICVLEKKCIGMSVMVSWIIILFFHAMVFGLHAYLHPTYKTVLFLYRYVYGVVWSSKPKLRDMIIAMNIFWSKCCCCYCWCHSSTHIVTFFWLFRVNGESHGLECFMYSMVNWLMIYYSKTNQCKLIEKSHSFVAGTWMTYFSIRKINLFTHEIHYGLWIFHNDR